jgi:hypothetical protein
MMSVSNYILLCGRYGQIIYYFFQVCKIVSFFLEKDLFWPVVQANFGVHRGGSGRLHTHHGCTMSTCFHRVTATVRWAFPITYQQ